MGGAEDSGLHIFPRGRCQNRRHVLFFVVHFVSLSDVLLELVAIHSDFQGVITTCN